MSRGIAIFPEREGGNDPQTTREAWERAIRRARPQTIIAAAAAYAVSTHGRPRRYVMGARRWLGECHWRDTCPQFEPLVWIEYGSPEWSAWAAFYRRARGKSPPLDKRGGWRFPSRAARKCGVTTEERKPR